MKRSRTQDLSSVSNSSSDESDDKNKEDSPKSIIIHKKVNIYILK
jgi:hypothetical protein